MNQVSSGNKAIFQAVLAIGFRCQTGRHNCVTHKINGNFGEDNNELAVGLVVKFGEYGCLVDDCSDGVDAGCTGTEPQTPAYLAQHR